LKVIYYMVTYGFNIHNIKLQLLFSRMKILITGIAGFVGSRLAEFFKTNIADCEIIGIDNLSRRGSETNLEFLKTLGCKFIHGDIRVTDDVNDLPKVDWIVDCAANPSVLAGINGGTSQLIGHNLQGTLNILEKCRKDNAGFILLSTSRVYAIEALNQIPLQEDSTRFSVKSGVPLPTGFTLKGVTESFSTQAPVSLYGATKLASEVMALEYAYTFGFPIWVNRCGVIAGAGQFGKIDQGIFSFWIYQWLLERNLGFIGFGGKGKQVRDFFSPEDLGSLLVKQMNSPNHKAPKIINAGGGLKSAMSLYELNEYCKQQFGFDKQIKTESETRPFDLPYYVTDNSEVTKHWDWSPQQTGIQILDDIVKHARANTQKLLSL
jgi:CDP-paratose 2-epimerase